MKMTVLFLIFCVFSPALANLDEPQIESYGKKVKTYRLEVPGKTPITIIETAPDEVERKWGDNLEKDKDDTEIRNLMTHIVHDVNENSPRCYGPSCHERFNENDGPQKDVDDIVVEYDKLKDLGDFPMDRLQAISMLAAKLKKEKLKADRYSQMSDEDSDDDEDNSKKVYTSWNRLKVKQHKHPYDDKDGWVSLEPVAWSTSKISKWKPNVKKPKPSYNWNDDEDRYQDEDDYSSNENQGYGNSHQGTGGYTYQKKKPAILARPGYINNKLHVSVSQDYDTELPSKPSWMKPQQNTFQASYPSSWSPDDSRRPHKPCDHDTNYSNDDTVYYGISDSVVTDSRPTRYPYQYEALHQPSQRPMKRPTQVVYAGSPDTDGDRSSRPPYGDGQWVLLSTTKGYRNKKRQRSLNLDPSDTAERQNDYKSMTSHQAVALTVLPADNAHKNMTTSHGGLLEVEKSFKTVEESKRDMDKNNEYDLEVMESQEKPVVVNKNKIVRKQVVSSVNSPDSSALLAAVGAGMVPATMAMVVPMMLGRRRRRDVGTWRHEDDENSNNVFFSF